jgi:hypothetical protein
LTVTLSRPVNATIGKASATGTIQNDDPVAQPGHYAGRDSQNETWSFDVTPDGRGLANLTTGQINMSCSYAGTTVFHTYGGNIHLTSTIPIAQNGSFSATIHFTLGMISGYAITLDVEPEAQLHHRQHVRNRMHQRGPDVHRHSHRVTGSATELD